MDKFEYQVGINLGGWLSQREVAQAISGLNADEHRKTFITKEDIQRIADWGFDHIRLPFDYELLEDDAEPFHYKEEGFAYIDSCLGWCSDNGLGVILDFHRAPGQTYSSAEPNPLLVNSINRDRYLALWIQLTSRYIDVRDGLVFELLNEIVDQSCYLYKGLIRHCTDSIRAVDAERKIIVGGNQYNSIFTLKELQLEDDPNIIYNFHFYEPIPFTHQRAYFSEEMKKYDTMIEYPGSYPGLIEFTDKHPEYADKNRAYVWNVNDKSQMEKYLKEALLFLEHTGRPLYCGEFGVIDKAPKSSKIAWLDDLIDYLNEHGIGRAYWSYKEMDYGLVDISGNVLDEDVIKIVTKKRKFEQ